jgi:hypothetical protein
MSAAAGDDFDRAFTMLQDQPRITIGPLQSTR